LPDNTHSQSNELCVTEHTKILVVKMCRYVWWRC